MSARVSFADLLKKGAEKDQQKINEKPKLSLIETKDIPTPPTPLTKATSPTGRTSPTPHTQATPSTSDIKLPVSPERDFTKVANSIVREAVAQGLFIGKSKQIYDFLYLRTRGAMQPTRTVRITKSNLMRGSDIGSERTLLKNLSHLKLVGLIKIREFDGQHGGNEYEVFMPEESEATPPTPLTSRQPRYAPQKVGTLPPVESGVGGVSQMQENKDTYGDAKTLFKDNIKTDDESATALFSDFIEKFQTAATKITGAQLSKYEREKWGRLADLLVLELETASRHASNPISSVPAFLTKVLSSKLLNQKPVERISKSKSGTKTDTVGKYYPEDDEIKPLSDESKEAAVDFLREFKDDGEFLDGYKKWYIEEDWNWIIKQLEIKN
jgi:hypothetical protein